MTRLWERFWLLFLSEMVFSRMCARACTHSHTHTHSCFSLFSFSNSNNLGTTDFMEKQGQAVLLTFTTRAVSPSHCLLYSRNTPPPRSAYHLILLTRVLTFKQCNIQCVFKCHPLPSNGDIYFICNSEKENTSPNPAKRHSYQR